MPTQATQKSSSVLGWLIWVVAVFALMLIFVWLKVETNLTLAHIRILEVQLNENIHENEKLRAEVVRLTSFGRIRRIAQSELGLTFVPSEQIVEISRSSRP